MDEQNNALQPEEGSTTPEQSVKPATDATQEMPAPQGQPVAPTQTMPVATQPAAPQAGAQPGAQPGAPIDPVMVQQNAAYNAQMGAYPPPKPTGALVCGILAIVFCWIPIIGIVLGIVAIVQASNYFKAGGAESSGKAGKICGIIGLVLSGIMIVINLCLVIFGLAVLDELDNQSTSLNAYSTTQPSSSAITGSLSDASPEDEAAVYEVVDAELDKIKNLDPAMVASISKVVADSLNDALATENLSLADLQVDPTALTTAMLKGFDYERYYVDASDDEAEANYHVTCKDMYSVLSAFYDQLMDMVETDVSQYGSEEAAYVAIGQVLMSSVEATTPSEGELFDVDLNKIGGNWVIDQESWNDEIEYFFGA